MFIYYARTFRAVSTSAVVKEAVCEKCECVYQYELVRRAEGSSSALYGIGARSARNNSEARAKRTLQKRLAKGVDPVGCPECGWYQTAMVRELRRRQHRWLLTIFWVVACLGTLLFVCDLLIATNGTGEPMRKSDQSLLIGVAGFTALLSAAVVGIRWLLLKAYDPNAGYPERPKAIPGSPVGVRKYSSPAVATNAHGIPLAPVPRGHDIHEASGLQYERLPPLVSRGGWVTVQLAKIQFPPLCCWCLEPTEAMKGFPLRGGRGNVGVRFCESCDHRLRRHRLLSAVVPGLVGGLLAGTPFLLRTSRSVETETSVTIVLLLAAAFVSAAIGYFVAQPYLRPVRFSRFSSTLNTVRIRFSNPTYTVPFADANNLA